MTIKLGSVALSAGVFSLIGLPVQADHHMEMQFAPTELMTCAYKEGKDNDDLKKLTNAFTKWVKKNDTAYTYYLLSPNWHEDASDWDFAWVGSWTSGAGMGAGYDAWMNDDDDVGAMFQDVMDCNYSLASVTPIQGEDDDGPWERGVVWFSRCELDDDAGLSDAIGAHRTMASAMTDMGQTSVSWAFLPALGFGDVEFDYYHVQAWPSYSQLGSGFDNYFNKGGWKVQADAQDDVVECASPNLYTFRLVHAGE
ncbi:hypothetical protein [Congregibacter litoralis]|uniref:Uncharacterized protein n=1 Tax=Congregibacter litoralis KT71 TaxID=314285 RepID=A4A698_9GAMM|nr:hypothetical protein [Congregibacter litoralis]EAQ98545.2 hypothetical protein KT71_01170 [Congregibacter litoralis KT71]